MSDDGTLGKNLKRLRGRISQRNLAARSGVSVSVIRHLEQGHRHTASIGSLQLLAKALDVPLVKLLGKRDAMPGDVDGVTSIRRALTHVDDLTGEPVDEEALDISDAERSLTAMWGAYWFGHYGDLARLIPVTLQQLRATHRQAPVAMKPKTARLLAHAYQATGDTLVHLGQADAAFHAVREALGHASMSDDPLLPAALKLSVSWQLLVQGRYDESQQVAVVAANAVEPQGMPTDSQVSLYGLLNATAATAAARNKSSNAATDLLDAAHDSAKRLGRELSDHNTTFGPAKVAMMTVDVHVVQDDFVGALTASKRLPRDAHLPLAARARHLADVALAQVRLGHYGKAGDTLLAMDSMAPDWIKHQSLPKQVLAELRDHQRRSSRLGTLATKLGVE